MKAAVAAGVIRARKVKKVVAFQANIVIVAVILSNMKCIYIKNSPTHVGSFRNVFLDEVLNPE